MNHYSTLTPEQLDEHFSNFLVDRWSYSAVDAFSRNEKEFEKCYIYNERSRKSASAVGGSAYHAALEYYFERLQEGKQTDLPTLELEACTYIDLVEANEWLGSSNGVLYTKDRNRAVMSPRGKKEFILAEPVQVIAGGGSQNAIFGGNGNTNIGGVQLSNNYTKVITMADLPASLDTIEDGAFVSADSLEYIICRAEEVPYTYVNTFRNVGTYYGWQTKVYVPAGSLEAYKNSFWVDKVSRPTEDGGTETPTEETETPAESAAQSGDAQPEA